MSATKNQLPVHQTQKTQLPLTPPPRCPVVLHAHQSRTPVCRSIDIVSGTCWRAATPSTKQKPSCPPSAPSPFSPKSTHESRTPVCQSTLSPPHAPPQHPKRSMRPPPKHSHTSPLTTLPHSPKPYSSVSIDIVASSCFGGFSWNSNTFRALST